MDWIEEAFPSRLAGKNLRAPRGHTPHLEEQEIEGGFPIRVSIQSVEKSYGVYLPNYFSNSFFPPIPQS